MMKHKRILVPVDLSKDADHAFEHALKLARRAGAELYLLHAVSLDHPYGHRAAERLARFADLRARAEAAGVMVQTVEQHGDAADVIVLHADTRPVDLVVMTSGRRTGWARWRQPSIAERVLRRTIRPTLIVRSDGKMRDGFHHVVAAVDLSPQTAGVIRGAVETPGLDVKQLTLVHSVENIEAADAYYSPARWRVAEYRSHVMDDARRAIEASVPDDIPSSVMTRVHVTGGPAADGIDVHADVADADLIVVGRSNRWTQLGSTATRLLRHSARSLLVVPPVAVHAARGEMPLQRAA